MGRARSARRNPKWALALSRIAVRAKRIGNLLQISGGMISARPDCSLQRQTRETSGIAFCD
jgi:hypothetical protein